MNKEQTPQLSLQELAFELAQALKIIIGDIKSKPNDTRYLTSMKVGANALLRYDEFRNSLTSPATVATPVSVEGFKSAEEIYEKYTGTNMELQYLPTPKENVIAAMEEYANQFKQPPC